MGIFKDIKKAFKGSKEFQKRKKGPISKAIKQVSGDVKKAVKGSKEYQKRKKGPISKAIKQVSGDVKRAVKGSKEYQAGKAKRKAAKAEKKAGKTWTKATKARKAAGGPNLSTLVKSRGMHKKGSSEYASIQNKINEAYGVKKRHGVDKKQLGGMVEPPTTPSISPQPAYKEGGKVSENNPYGWPSRDARNGGKK